MLVVAFVAVGMIRERSFNRRVDSRPTADAVLAPPGIPARHTPGPTPTGKAYLTTQRVPVYRCADIACRRPALLPKGMRVWALAAAKGPVVNGSSVWIEFRLHGVPAYLPVSYLAPLR